MRRIVTFALLAAAVLTATVPVAILAAETAQAGGWGVDSHNP